VAVLGQTNNIHMRNTILSSVVLKAYDLKPYQLECPAWMRTEEYDISATAPAGSTPDQIPAMLQNLLADRFRMKLHREKRDWPVYALVVGKDGPKLKAMESANEQIGFTMGRPETTLTAVSTTGFARMLSGFLDRPVLDMTGLTGYYDIKVTVAASDLVGMRSVAMPGIQQPSATEAVTAPSIFTAVQDLGLRLESRKAPIEFLIVDRADKDPTEN
jgi:uncharacterized protein (TIGR03435 family)